MRASRLAVTEPDMANALPALIRQERAPARSRPCRGSLEETLVSLIGLLAGGRSALSLTDARSKA